MFRINKQRERVAEFRFVELWLVSASVLMRTKVQEECVGMKGKREGDRDSETKPWCNPLRLTGLKA